MHHWWGSPLEPDVPSFSQKMALGKTCVHERSMCVCVCCCALVHARAHVLERTQSHVCAARAYAHALTHRTAWQAMRLVTWLGRMGHT
eukprot:14432828-Alexandrium_andersonii.AAC.1